MFYDKPYLLMGDLSITEVFSQLVQFLYGNRTGPPSSISQFCPFR